MMHGEAGKGDRFRPVDKKKFDENFERIFRPRNRGRAMSERQATTMAARIAELEAEVERLRGYTVHDVRCALTSFQAFDPAKGFLYGDEWLKEPPPCTCGLDKKELNP